MVLFRLLLGLGLEPQHVDALANLSQRGRELLFQREQDFPRIEVGAVPNGPSRRVGFGEDMVRPFLRFLDYLLGLQHRIVFNLLGLRFSGLDDL